MTRFTLLPLAVAFATISPAMSADAPAPGISPVFRMQSNAYEAWQLYRHVQATWGDDVDIPEMVFMLMAMLGEQPPKRDLQVAVQLNLTQSEKGYVQEIVMPATAPMLEEITGSASSEWIAVGDYVGVIQASGSGSDSGQMDPKDALTAYGGNLRKTLQQVVDHSATDIVQYEFYPTQLKNTPACTKLQGLIASASTLAQRRDNEERNTHAVRSAGIRFLAESGQMCLSHLDSLSMALRRGEAKRSVEASMKLQTSRKSPLASALNQFGQVRNRSLSYLHPDHEGFAAVALPLPEILADPVVLNGLFRMTPVSQDLEDSAALVLDAVLQRLSESCCQTESFEMLIQTVPCDDKSSALVIVFPLRDENTGALEKSGIQQVGFTPSDFDIDDGNAWCLVPSLVDIGTPQYSLHIVESDDCIALLIGSDTAQPAFSRIIRRDFDESPSGQRYANSAIAIGMPLASEWPNRILGTDDLWASRKSKRPLRTRLTAFTDVNHGSFEFVARFEEDAALLGAQFVSSVLESVMEDGLEWLFD